VQWLCEHPTYTNDKVNKKDNNNDIVIDLECKRVFNNRQQFFFLLDSQTLVMTMIRKKVSHKKMMMIRRWWLF
jgi:hypothetical protein